MVLFLLENLFRLMVVTRKRRVVEVDLRWERNIWRPGCQLCRKLRLRRQWSSTNKAALWGLECFCADGDAVKLIDDIVVLRFCFCILFCVKLFDYEGVRCILVTNLIVVAAFLLQFCLQSTIYFYLHICNWLMKFYTLENRTSTEWNSPLERVPF